MTSLHQVRRIKKNCTMTSLYSGRLTEVRRKLVELFSLEEFRVLCSDLDVYFDNLRGETFEGKTDALFEHLEHRGQTSRLLALLQQQRPSIDWTPLQISSDDPPPFKGLQFFDVQDASLFFGREQLIAKLIGRLRHSPLIATATSENTGRFLAIVGASGSGKSSLVRAGVVASLLKGGDLANGLPTLPGISEKHTYLITPTDRPLNALAAALTHDSPSVLATTQLIDDLHADARALDIQVSRLLHNNTSGVVLIVVDQFEELFTLCRDVTDQKAFVDGLLHACDAAHAGRTYVILTLRADFYAQCSKFDRLRESIAAHQEYIGPMDEQELRRAIEEPARLNGCEFEPGLVTTLLDDAGDEPGALPLLSHALLETWKRREGRRLTLRGYDDSGRLRGAIAHTADEVYGQLSTNDQLIARNILLRLTELGEGTQDTRRRAQMRELFPRAEDEPAVRAVLKTLTDRRLVITSEEMAEVAHEALIREWPQLRQWLGENREGLRVHRQLSEDAHEWEGLLKSPDVLYRGAKLTVATEWARQQPYGLNELERLFLTESEAARVRERDERNRQQQEKEDNLSRIADAEAARAAEKTRRLKWARLLSLGLVLGLVFAVGALFYALQQTDIAVTQKLAYKASDLAASESDTALLLANYAQQRANVNLSEVREGLIRANQCCPDQLVGFLRGHADRVWAVAFHPVLTTVLASVSDDGFIIIWDIRTRHEITRFEGPASGAPVYSLAFSPNGKLLATGHGNGEIIFWDTTSWAKDGQSLAGHDGNVHSIAFNADGSRLVSGGADGQVIVWDVHTRTIQRAFKEHTNWVWSVAFSPDGRAAISGGRDKVFQLYTLDAQQSWITLTQPFTEVNANVVSLAFWPDPTHTGKAILAAGDASSKLSLWDVSAWIKNTGKPVVITRQTLSGVVWGLAFSPDGNTIGTGTEGGRVKIFQMRVADPISQTKLSNASLAMLAHTAGVFRIALSTDANILAAGSIDRLISLWQLREPANYVRLAMPIDSISYSPKDQILTVSGAGPLTGTVLITSKSLSTTMLSRTVVITLSHPVSATALSSNGSWAAAVSDYAHGLRLSLWRVDEAMPAPTTLSASAHLTDVTVMRFSPNGQHLATGDRNGLIAIWAVDSGQIITSFVSGHKGRVRSLAFNTDGTLLASGGCFSRITVDKESSCGRGEVRIWNTVSWRPHGTSILAKSGYVNAIAFYPDSQSIVTGSDDRVVVVWDIATHQSRLTLTGHGSRITALAVSADANWLATGEDAWRIMLWDLHTGRRVGASFNEQDDDVIALWLSSDGNQLISASIDSVAISRDLRQDFLAERACRIAGRSLSQAEWDLFVGTGQYQHVCP